MELSVAHMRALVAIGLDAAAKLEQAGIPLVPPEDRACFLAYRPGGVNGWISNRSCISFKANGMHYRSVEHYLQWRKATTMGDYTKAGQILEARTPADANELGTRLENWDPAKWSAIADNALYTALMLKAMQNPFVRVELEATGDAIIGFASPLDTVFGTGVGIDDPLAHKCNEWRGKNLLGRTWMLVRRELWACLKNQDGA